MKASRLVILALLLAGCPSDPTPTTPRPRASTAPGAAVATAKPGQPTPTPVGTPTATPTPASRQALLLGEDGQPAVGVTVRGYVGETATLETKTDERGRFTLQVPADTAITVEAVATDDLKAIAQAVTQTDGLTLQLAPVGSLDGHVAAPAAPGVKDFTGVTVIVPGTGYTTQTDAAGHFHLGNVAAGTFALTARRTGLGKGRLDGQVVKARQTTPLPELVLTPLVPAITAITPAAAGPGATLTLKGDQLGAGALEVRFGSTVATQATRKDDETIEVVVPAGAASGDVTVVLDGVPSASKPFTVLSQLDIQTAMHALQPGQHLKLAALARDAAGKAAPAPGLTWKASGPAVDVDAQGVVTAKAAGRVTLTASSGTLQSTPFDLEVLADPVVIGTLAGIKGTGSTYEGVGTAVQLGQPSAVAVDDQDTLYVADLKGWISTCTTDGKVTRLAELPAPKAIAVDTLKTCYVATQNKIMKVAPTGQVSAFVGAEIAGQADGTGAAASFNQPLGLALAADGTLFVHDTGNGRIRMVTPAGVVSTLGVTSVGTHGPGLRDAGPLAIGPDGALYLAGPGTAFAKVDLKDRAHPVLTALLPDPFTPGAHDVAPKAVEGMALDAKGRLVFLDGAYLRQLDLTTPAHPKLVTLAGFGSASGVTSADGAGGSAGTGDLVAIAASPTHAGVYFFLEWGPNDGQQRVRRLGLAP